MSDNDTTKRAVLYLLARGLATHAEAAKLAGKSRQLIRFWAKDLPEVRSEYLKSHWEAALRQAENT